MSRRKRALQVLAVGILLLAGALWVRRSREGLESPAKRSGAEIQEAHRREHAAALAEQERRKREVLDRPPAGGGRRDLDHLTALDDAEKRKLQELYARVQAARQDLARGVAARAGQGAESLPPSDRSGTEKKQEEAAARLKLTLEVPPGPILIFRPLPLRITLENPGLTSVDLRMPLGARLEAVVLEVQGPGDSAWTSVHLVQDTSSSGWSPRILSIEAGAKQVVHTEIPGSWGYDPSGGRFTPGPYRLRARFRSVEKNRARPEAETQLEAVEPQGPDRAALRWLIDQKASGLLGVRAPDLGGFGSVSWEALAEWVSVQPPSAYLQDLRTGLLVTAWTQLPPGALSDAHRAAIRRLLDGVPDPAGWPYAERLLAKAEAARRIGEAALADAWRQAFARACPGDVRLGSGR